MTAIELRPAYNARVREVSQEELDLQTVRLPPGAVSEFDVLDACNRLLCSHDWQTRYLAVQVRGAVMFPDRPAPMPTRRFTLDSVVFWVGVGFVAVTLAALLYQSWLNFWIVTEVLVGGV